MLVVILILSVAIAAVAVGIYMMTPAGRMLRSTEPPPEPDGPQTEEKPGRHEP
jgi:hypothetical protein